MTTETQVEQLNIIVDRLLDLYSRQTSRTLLAQVSPPFDVSRPNIHDSKREFINELETVEAIIQHLEGLLEHLMLPNPASDPDRVSMLERLSLAIEVSAYQNQRRQVVNSASDLALKNLRETGFVRNSTSVSITMLGSRPIDLVAIGASD